MQVRDLRLMWALLRTTCSSSSTTSWCEARLMAFVAWLALEGHSGDLLESLSEPFCAKVDSAKLPGNDELTELLKCRDLSWDHIHWPQESSHLQIPVLLASTNTST